MKKSTNKQYIKQVKEMLPDGSKLLYLTHFGSALYGTNSKVSDVDLKGIYIPSLQSCVLGTSKETIKFTTGENHSKNTENDMDVELYSIQHFCKLLKKGEVGTIDLLFSMFSNKIIYGENRVQYIKNMKYSLVSKNSKSFIGYAMNQASRYGIRGKRYNAVLELIEFLETLNEKDKIADVIDLILAKNINYITKEADIKNPEVQYIKVLESKYNFTFDVKYLKKQVQQKLESFGSRAKLSAEGIDWKSLSHAYRVIMEINELSETGKIEFPLVYSDKIKEIKYAGTNENVDNFEIYVDDISDKISLTEDLILKSRLKDDVTQEDLDKLIMFYYNFLKV